MYPLLAKLLGLIGLGPKPPTSVAAEPLEAAPVVVEVTTAPAPAASPVVQAVTAAIVAGAVSAVAMPSDASAAVAPVGNPTMATSTAGLSDQGMPLRWTKIAGGRLVETLTGRPIRLAGTNQGTWGKTQQHDAGDLIGRKANVTRRVFRYGGWYSDPTTDSRMPGAPYGVNPANLAKLMQEVQWDLDAGMLTVITIDSNVGINGGLQDQTQIDYSLDPTKTTIDPLKTDPALWPYGHNAYTDPVLADELVVVAKWLADNLKKYPNIVLYEVAAEPLVGFSPDNGFDSTWGDKVRDLNVRLMDAIKNHDHQAFFLAGPRDGYNIGLISEAVIPGRWDYLITGNGFWHVDTTASFGANCDKWDKKLARGLAVAKKASVGFFFQQWGIRNADDTAAHDYLQHSCDYMEDLDNFHDTHWQYRQNPDMSAKQPMAQFALMVSDPRTEEDVPNTPVLAILSAYWARVASKVAHA